MSALATVPRETLGAGQRLEELPLSAIDVGENVRVDAGDMAELVASIAELGVLQPVRAIGPNKAGRYRLVWGQRRYLACSQLGLPTIPALVEPTAEADKPGARRSIEQLAENLQRKDLNPIEEAVALRAVLDGTKGLTQDALAKRLGVSAPWVSNTLNLLDVAPKVQDLVREERLTASHVKALRGLAPKTQTELAKEAVERGASAHGLEQLVQQHKRNAEWQKEQQARSVKEAAARKERLAAGLARLASYKVPLDAPIRVTGYYNKDEIAALVKGAGYTDVKTTGDVFARTSAVDCDCTAWKVEGVWDGGMTVSKGCTKRAHIQAKDRLQSANDDARRKLGEQCKTALKARLLEEARGLPPMLARVVLWHALEWSVNDWVRDHKTDGKKADAWSALSSLTDEQLATEISTYLSKSLRDQNGIKLDFDVIAAELGIAEPPAAPPAKPAKGKAPKFTPSQAAAAAAEMDAEGLT